MEITKRLDSTDHDILLHLIRGLDINEAAKAENISRACINGRLLEMRKITESRTVYALVALETINLMCAETWAEKQMGMRAGA